MLICGFVVVVVTLDLRYTEQFFIYRPAFSPQDISPAHKWPPFHMKIAFWVTEKDVFLQQPYFNLRHITVTGVSVQE